MASIIETQIQVFTGLTPVTQVGSTITSVGSPASVNLDVSTLGLALSPGSQYNVRARCTNDEQYTTPWTSPSYTFKTLILAEFTSLLGGCGNLSPEMLFTYDSNVLSVSECGMYVSTNASGANATKIVCTGGEQEAGQGWVVSTLNENTNYYCVAYVVDSDGREFCEAWADAEQANTSYRAPVVTISNIATTYNGITANAHIATNDTLSGAYVTLQATGGGTLYRKNLSNTVGTQTISFEDGDTDYQGNTITISPSTEYRLTVYSTNTSGCSGNGQAVATTAAQAQASIAITSVTNITPVSAQVNLSYGIISGD